MSECNEHEWVVYSYSGGLQELKLQCVECGLLGSVESPSRSAIAKVGLVDAPFSGLYLWPYANRVIPGVIAPPRVIRWQPGENCDCLDREHEYEMKTPYQRLPGGISVFDRPLTRKELDVFAKLCTRLTNTGLCSRNFQAFLTAWQAVEKMTLPKAVTIFAKRVDDALLHNDLHMTPAGLRYAIEGVLVAAPSILDDARLQ